MIATLPMYDRPETALAHDALWAAIRDGLRADGHAAPDHLSRDIAPSDGWTRPDLVLSQACGLPYRRHLHGRVQLVGTFDYGLPDTPPGHYRSVFVVAADARGTELRDFDGAGLAYNQADSHSGWAAPQITARALGLSLPAAVETGSHRGSARAVAEGRATIAAIDEVTWRGILRWDGDIAARLRVIGRTEPAPALPLITASPAPAPAAGQTAVATLRAAIARAVRTLDPELRGLLGIRALLDIPASDYLAVPTPPDP